MAKDVHSSSNTFLTLGMVSAPVKLFLASSDERESFSTVHRNCSTKLEHHKFCPACDRQVAATEVAKGYQYEKGRLVTIEESELASLALGDKRIDIIQVAPAASVDPLRFTGKVYYVGSTPKVPDDAYRLLFATIDPKLAALCKFTTNGRTRLGLLTADNSLGCFVLRLLFYADEMRNSNGVSRPSDKPVEPAHLALAKKLAGTITAKQFDLDSYRDEYNDRVRELVAKKLEGGEIAAPAPAQRPAVDLMAMLEASVASLTKSDGAAEAVEQDVAA